MENQPVLLLCFSPHVFSGCAFSSREEGVLFEVGSAFDVVLKGDGGDVFVDSDVFEDGVDVGGDGVELLLGEGFEADFEGGEGVEFAGKGRGRGRGGPVVGEGGEGQEGGRGGMGWGFVGEDVLLGAGWRSLLELYLINTLPQPHVLPLLQYQLLFLLPHPHLQPLHLPFPLLNLPPQLSFPLPLSIQLLLDLFNPLQLRLHIHMIQNNLRDFSLDLLQFL